MELDPETAKTESERTIQGLGGKINPGLPHITLDEIQLRDQESVVRRVLALVALVSIGFGAPRESLVPHLDDAGCLGSFTESERSAVVDGNLLSDEERIEWTWYIECLFAAAWVGQLVDSFSPIVPTHDDLSSLYPKLNERASVKEFLNRFRMRSLEEIYSMLDLFYRSHWWVRQSEIEGVACEPFDNATVYFRRLFLEWVLHSDVDWEEVELDT